MRRWPLLLVLTACDAVFDLRGRDAGQADSATVDGGPCPGDRDCDWIVDGVDNCIDVHNSEQRNSDGDALGDLCDPCSSQRTEFDSDFDGVADLEDNCPGLANAAQGDDDEDNVGNACDDEPPVSALRCFYGFESASELLGWTYDTDNWLPAGQGAGGGHVVANGGVPLAVLVGAGLSPDVPRFAIAVALETSTAIDTSIEVGISLGTREEPLGPRCVLTTTGEHADTFNAIDDLGTRTASLPGSPPAVPRRTITIVVDRSVQPANITCTELRDGVTNALAMTASLPDAPVLTLVANGAVVVFHDVSIYELDGPPPLGP